MVQDINLLPSDDNQVKIEIVDRTNIVPQDEKENRLAQRSSVTTLISGNTIDITIPDNIFNQEVPFSFAQRSVNISIPKDKKIIYNNNSALSYSTPRTWFETQEGKEYKLYCEDTLSFIYHTGSDSWRCGNTSQSEVNKNNTNLSDWDGRSPEDYSDEALERMFLGISLEQAQVIADSKDRTLRITQQDGLELPSDNDYVPGRLNLEITQGLITDVEIE